jgi:hypothetical protein
MQFAEKGYNETLEITYSLEDTLALIAAVKSHVPENGGTCRMFTNSTSGWK